MKERMSSCGKLVLVALLALALGACGPESTPTPEPPTEVVLAPTDTPVPSSTPVLGKARSFRTPLPPPLDGIGQHETGRQREPPVISCV